MDAEKIVQFSELGSEPFVITFNGALNIDSVPAVWQSCLNEQKQRAAQTIMIDASRIDSCDTAAIALFAELNRRQLEQNRAFQLQSLAPAYQKLYEMMVSESSADKETITHVRFSDRIRMSLGYFAVGVVDDIKENIQFIGKVAVELFSVLIQPQKLRWGDTWRVAQQTGPNALPIIVLLGFLIGFISAFQSAIPLERFGAQIYIGTLVGISLFREMGPLMTAIILAGRTASSFSAEIGTMKINQEVDALTTMGLDSVRFLILPRIVAATVMTPLLNIFLIFFGLVGCGIVMQTLGFSVHLYIEQLKTIVSLSVIVGSLIKATTFGFIIAGIGCMNGLKTTFGASAVGRSTTRSVVAAIIMIVIVDGIFAALFYSLRI